VQGITLAGNGDLLVANDGNNTVRRITQTGVVSVAASGFNGPSDVAFDKNAGFYYVSEHAGNQIKKVTAAGVVSVFAGSGSLALINGTGLAASFNVPHKIDIDALGNLYVSDTGHSVIRKVTSAGLVTTLIGSGTSGGVDGLATQAQLAGPHGVVLDLYGNLYVVEPGANKVRKVTPGTLENLPLNFTIVGNDVEGDTLSYAIAVQPVNGVAIVDIYSGAVTYTPNALFAGVDSLTVQVADIYGAVKSVNLSLTVAPVNHAPVISTPASPHAVVVAEDSYSSFSVSATDIDGNALSWDIYSAAANGTATIDAYGNVSYIGHLNYSGVDSFTVRVSDPYAASALLAVNATVFPVNDAPTIISPVDNYTVNNNLGSNRFVPIAANDVDGDTWSVQILTQPADGYAVVTGAGIDYYGATSAGLKQLTYNVVDSYGLPSSLLGQTLFINVIASQPVITSLANPHQLRVAVDSYANFAVTASDPNAGELLNWDIYSAALNGTATVDSYGNVSYLGGTAYAGEDTFTVRVSDQLGLTDTLKVNVMVSPASGGAVVSGILDNYAGTTGTLWQYGVPLSGPNATSAITADPYVWATNLTGNYPTTATETLYLPLLDLTAATNPTLSMRIWSSTSSNDGTSLQGFDPLSGNWITVNPYSTTQQYDTATTVGSAWGNVGSPAIGSTAYRFSAFDLSALNGNTVQLRLVFSASGVNTTSGTYVDEIRLDEESFDYDSDGIAGVLNEWNSTYSAAHARGTDPFVTDSDGDGLNDAVDAAPLSSTLAGGSSVMGGVLDQYAYTLGSVWQYGVPASGPNATSAITADPYVWATNLVGNYPMNAHEVLYLPLLDMTAAASPTLSMRIWSSASSADGASVEAYDSLGGTWNIINPYSTTQQYNTATSGGSAWGTVGAPATGSGAYQFSAFDLTAWNGGTVQLRLVFRASGINTTSGIYVDEIRVDEESFDHDNDGINGVLNEWNTLGYVGLDPFVADSDGDGANDGAEISAGTDPLNALSTPSTAMLSAISEVPSGTVTGAAVNVTATLLDNYSVPIANTIIRFAIQTSPTATFTQNGLQTIDVYTNAGGTATATVTDNYAETVPVLVSTPNYGTTSVTVNQLFAVNTGPTVVTATDSSNNISGANCNTIWTAAGSPYWVQSNVAIATGCKLQIEANTVVKFNAGLRIDVNSGGVLDVYGTAAAAVILTSVNDDAYGAVLAGSTGTPAVGSWTGINYNSGSTGSMAFATVNYAATALYVQNSSPVLSDFTANEFSTYGLHLYTTAGQTTSPTVSNIVLNTTDLSNQPIFMKGIGAGAGLIAPTITGGSITTASTNTGWGAIHLNSFDVNPTISGLTVNGGAYSLKARLGAGGTFTGNTFNGAINQSIYLESSQPAININSSNTLTNAPAPYILDGQSLPVDVYATFGAGVVDIYSLHFMGVFTAANTIMGPDPIGNGNSIWLTKGNPAVDTGARVQIDANTVIKFKKNSGFTVRSGATLDVYGTVGQPVIFTSINDDAYGAIVNGSTGAPSTNGWNGLLYKNNSLGSMNYADIYYAVVGLKLTNLSLEFSNLNIREFATSGIHLLAASGETTSPTITNLNLSTTNLSNKPLNFAASGTGIIAPMIIGGTITTASTGNSKGAITLSGAGTTPTISGFNINGSAYSIYSTLGAGGTFTNNTFDGALINALYLSDAGTVIVDASNTINNTPAPYLLTGMALPAAMIPTFGTGIVDVYSVQLTGSFTAANTILGPDPLGTGNSVYQTMANIAVSSGARLQIDPYTIIKFGGADILDVNSGGVLDVYGAAAAQVIFTSINDDANGAVIPGSTGTPAAGSWPGIKYNSGSTGSMAFATVNYATTALYVTNSSPIVSDFTANEFGTYGLDLYSTTGQTTSPTVSNIVLNTTDISNAPIYMLGSSGASSLAPTITGGSITTASTNTGYGSIYLNGLDVNATISGLTVNGGAYSLLAATGAAGTLTGNTFNGAVRSGVYLNTTGLVAASGNKVLNNNTSNTALDSGITVLDVAIGTVIENNLIRGNQGSIGGGIYIVSATAPEIRNNLVIENSAVNGGGIGVVGNVVLNSNTVAHNSTTSAAGGGGLYASATATLTASDNIFAFNEDSMATRDDMLIDIYAAVTEDFNLVSDGPSVALNDVYADPLFASGWHLSGVSPAVNAGSVLASATPFITSNPYTEVALADIGNLDMGYHHAGVTSAVSAGVSTVTVDTTTPGMNGVATITVIPKDSLGNLLGSGMQLSAVITQLGSTVGSVSNVRDLGDGSYEFKFTATATTGGFDTIAISVNGVTLPSPVTITW